MKYTAICFLFALLGPWSAMARPTEKDLAARYAALHPNTGATEECQELMIEDRENIEIDPLNAMIATRYLWPQNTAYYTIRSGYTAAQISRIEAGINDLVQLTRVNGQNCINIRPRTTQNDYIYIEKYSGCSSYVGRIGGAQRMSLVDGCVNVHGTIMHEFLHALGFIHEQSRPDRDDWVIINWDNIQPGYEGNFAKQSSSVVTTLGTSYDYGSVMHYGAYGFAIDKNEPTIIPKDPNAEIGQRVTLSALDIERVQIHYGCISAADSVYFKHLAQ